MKIFLFVFAPRVTQPIYQLLQVLDEGGVKRERNERERDENE